MWLAILAQGALACSPNATLYGFADWVDGAVDLPTDGRVVVQTGPMFPLTFTRLDTGEVTEGVPTLGLPHLQAFFDDVTYGPATPLAPNTTYRVDVSHRYETESATFTTGPGPTPIDFAPPVLSALATTGWAAGGLSCVIEGVARTITASVDVPDGLPVGSYVAIRSPWSAALFEHVALAADTTLDVASYERSDATPEDLALHDCLTPVLILPSGHEIAGVEVCIAPPPEPDAEDTAGDTAADVAATGGGAGEPPGQKGCGCATGGDVGSWALAVMALGLARRRRG